MSTLRDSWSAYMEYTCNELPFEKYKDWVTKYDFVYGPSGVEVSIARGFHFGFIYRADCVKDGLAEALSLMDEAKDVIHQIRHREREGGFGRGLIELSDSDLDGLYMDVCGWIDMLIDDIENRLMND